MRWTIGLRNLKTGLAICICVVVAALLRLEYPFYAAIATIISMENSVTNSFTAGKHRTMGTFVGAIVGASFALVAPGNAVYCAIGVIIVIYICNVLKWNKSISIGCIVFLAIMLNLDVGEGPIFYGLNRITDTLIGIAVAVVVNLVIFPPKHEVYLQKARKAAAKKVAEVFDQVVERGEKANLKGLRDELNALEKYYRLCKEEFHLTKDQNATMDQIGEEIESYRHIYEHLIIVWRLVNESHPALHFKDGADRNEVGNLDEDISQRIDIVYNYHVNWIFNELQQLGLPVPLKEKIHWAPDLQQLPGRVV
ncbi:FUSC family protein [Paenibacillus sanguinis]|uniref:FUSC family protein n=1 Tax=Paenibacillus sanguinis TaxID=225906 RepID=UPI0003720492|nr:aromatic acid exporter family protein [Paenibacillus sanguinis]